MSAAMPDTLGVAKTDCVLRGESVARVLGFSYGVANSDPQSGPVGRPVLEATQDIFQELLGESLSGVTFVQDYLQLQFNPPPVLNVYTPVVVASGGQSARFGEAAFANLLIGQINKSVISVGLIAQESLSIGFEDDSAIVVSLLPGDHVGPEGLSLFCRDGGMAVLWQASPAHA
jgi:hypothetical protein